MPAYHDRPEPCDYHFEVFIQLMFGDYPPGYYNRQAARIHFVMSMDHQSRHCGWNPQQEHRP